MPPETDWALVKIERELVAKSRPEMSLHSESTLYVACNAEKHNDSVDALLKG